MVCNNLFENVMGGHEANDAISDQIWNYLVQSDIGNVVEKAETEQEPVHLVHID